MPRIPRVAHQTTFFLFPILIIPVPDMESPQRDPRPPTLPTAIQVGPDATHDERAYHIPILRLNSLRISPRIALYTPSYNLQTSPICSCPDIAHGCPFRKALSGRTWRSIMPYYATQSSTVLPNIDIRPLSHHLCPITRHRAKIKKIAKCHILYTPYYPILPYLSSSFTLTPTLRIDTR